MRLWIRQPLAVDYLRAGCVGEAHINQPHWRRISTGIRAGDAGYG